MANEFYETFFLKTDSVQDTQLQEMRKNYFSNKEEMHMLEMGIQGEQQVMYHLNKSNIGMYALRDIYLTYENYTAQIDFVLITSHHCYFVECKNYNANIVHVDEAGNFSLSTRYGKKYNKMGIKSPLSQADEQLSVFLKIALNDQDKMKEMLGENRFKNYFKTMTVFTNSENVLNLKKAPGDMKYRVLKVENLVRQIQYDDEHFKGKRLTPNEMKTIADYILGLHSSRTVYITDRPIPVNSIGGKTKTNQSEKKAKVIAIIGGVIAVGLFFTLLFFLLLIRMASNKNQPRTNINNNSNSSNITETNKNTNTTTLNENQKKALSILKSAYKTSEANGFEIVHTSICKQMSSMINDELSCAGRPLYVNMYNDEKTITIYHTFTCYKFIFNSQDELLSATKKYVGNDIEKECQGLPIGLVEWDDNNEYYQKIGGYDKIREMAITIRKEEKKVIDFCDFNHIEERGGNKQLSSTYMLDVDRYFSGVTDRGFSGPSDTTSEEFAEMVKNYYYIMK